MEAHAAFTPSSRTRGRDDGWEHSVHRWRTVILAAATSILLASAGAAVLVHGSDDEALTLRAAGGPGRGYGFTVQAQPVHPLYPGATRHIRLAVSNPYDFALEVTAMHGEVSGTSNPPCRPTSANLRIFPYAGALPVRIDSHGHRAVHSLTVAMPKDAAPECERATFTIVLVGSAKRAG